ncbi:hypothetical protein PG993_007795 [Apiospora rasikravindrae]|uniref:Uncharacterized protein n=1 Tax=Apiospora rasikravindrae TaxID=990691 RepID=A0ABR1SYI0_9PEZI
MLTGRVVESCRVPGAPITPTNTAVHILLVREPPKAHIYESGMLSICSGAEAGMMMQPDCTAMSQKVGRPETIFEAINLLNVEQIGLSAPGKKAFQMDDESQRSEATVGCIDSSVASGAI